MTDIDFYKEPTEDGIKAAQEAITLQGEITALESRVKDLKARRDTLLTEAVRGYVRNCDGWTLVPTQPKREVSFARMLEYDADLADAYTEWFRDTVEVKPTVTSLTAYAKAIGIDPDILLGAVTIPGEGDGSVHLKAPKGAKE